VLVKAVNVVRSSRQVGLQTGLVPDVERSETCEYCPSEGNATWLHGNFSGSADRVWKQRNVLRPL